MTPLLAGQFAGELMLTIAGGVAAGLILEALRPRRESQSMSISNQRPRGGDSFFAGLLRLILSVAGGVLIAYLLARPLIQAGIAPRGMPTRLGLVIGGSALIWIILHLLRRR